MAKKKPYFPNNWKKLKDVPSDYFESVGFDEFMDWKIAGWEIPSSVKCIVRETNLNTGKIKEYTFSRYGDANNKIKKLMSNGDSEFTICDHENLSHLYPEFITDDDDSTIQ